MSVEKMKFETPDMTAGNVEKIAELFPNCVTEMRDENGKVKRGINFEMLKQMLSPDVMDGDECYEFTWVGKKASIAEANRPIRKTLRPCPEESKDWDTTENLYIEGDNLEVLKLLQESYLGKVKMIYIDPPYNTGNDFIYADDFMRSQEEENEQMGMYDEDENRLFKNTDTNGRFHSDWCSMMYSRLMLARNLLGEEGFIAISIDNNEQNNLQKICNDIFGEKNFLVNICVNRTSEIASNYTIDKHEYVLVYLKNYECFTLRAKEKYTISRGTVGNINQTMPIVEFPAGLNCYGIEDGVYEKTRKKDGSLENIENYDSIVIENGKLKFPVKLKARWRSSNDMRNFFGNKCQPTQAKINGEIVEIYFENTRFNPQIKKRTYEKIPSVFLDNKRGSDDLKKLKMGSFIDFPKSVAFIKFLLSFVEKDTLIMDFFSGSATTAHAVMQLNAEDGGHRKFIMVQLPEPCDEQSEAYKAGYKNICEIGKERIRRAGEKIKAESGLTAQNLDVGFRVLKLADSNMKDVYYAADDYKQVDLLDMVSNIKDDRTDLDLLFGCLIDWGLPLSLPYTSEKIEGCTVHTYNDGDLIACFDANIPESVVKEIASRKPLRAVFRDSSFANSPAKINVFEIFKLYMPEDADDISKRVRVI